MSVKTRYAQNRHRHHLHWRAVCRAGMFHAQISLLAEIVVSFSEQPDASFSTVAPDGEMSLRNASTVAI